MTNATEEKQLPMQIAQRIMQPMISEGEARNIAKLFITAGLFEPSQKEIEKGMTAEKKEALAAVRILYGSSLGLSPFAAMKAVHIISGKPELGYQAVLALVAAHPLYDYKILQSTDEAAEIEWFKHGKSLGKSKFTTADMQKAQLGGPIWQKHPRQMRIARAVREGHDKFCPEVSSGMCSSTTDQDYDIVCAAELEAEVTDATEYGPPDENGEVKPVAPKQQSRSQAGGKTAQAAGQTGKPQSDAQKSKETATSASQGAETAPTAGSTPTPTTSLIKLEGIAHEFAALVNSGIVDGDPVFDLATHGPKLREAFGAMFGGVDTGRKVLNHYLMNVSEPRIGKDNAHETTWEICKGAIQWARNPANTQPLISG